MGGTSHKLGDLAGTGGGLTGLTALDGDQLLLVPGVPLASAGVWPVPPSLVLSAVTSWPSRSMACCSGHRSTRPLVTAGKAEYSVRWSALTPDEFALLLAFARDELQVGPNGSRFGVTVYPDGDPGAAVVVRLVEKISYTAVARGVWRAAEVKCIEV